MNLRNVGTYIRQFLKIRDKEGFLISLVLNKPQQRLYRVFQEQWRSGKPVRIIILKARQMGFSTLTAAVLFVLTVTRFLCETMFVAHDDKATANLFRMANRFYENLPEEIQPMRRTSNAQELYFDAPKDSLRKGLGSRIRCATAGGKGVGRSYTLTCLHLSEYAFWPGNKKETFTGLVQAVPDKPGTVIVVESTANGYDDFKKLWDAAVQAQRDGTDGFVPVFFAWFEMDEYRRTPLPGFQRTDEEEKLAATFGLDDEQLAWRRWCIANNCGGDVDLFHQEYPSTPDEAFISTGRCAFNKPMLVLRRKQVQSVQWEYGRFAVQYDLLGKISSYRWVPERDGPIRIRKKTENGVPYVIGADTAGTGSDWFAAHALDNRTGEQVAVLHQQFGERAFAEQLYCLGKYYNDALIGVETNYSTFPQICLEELGYHRFYVRQRYDDFTGAFVDAFGFETTTKSRPVIVDNLKDVAKQALETIFDYDTLGEMLTFVYDQQWKAQAEQGEHDDLVMSLAIAHGIRSQQHTTVSVRTEPGQTVWTKDMWQDFNKAGPEDRERMLKMWGRPM